MTREEVKKYTGERVALRPSVKFEGLSTGDTGLRIIKLTRSGYAYLTKDDKHYINVAPRDVYLKSDYEERQKKYWKNHKYTKIGTVGSSDLYEVEYIGPKIEEDGEQWKVLRGNFQANYCVEEKF